MPPPPDPVEHAAKEVREHPDAGALAALVFDVVSRQAEARTLFSGQEFVARRAEEHGVSAERAQTGSGSLLSILERGPETEGERHLLGCFAVRGLRDRLRTLEGEERTAAVQRFVRHADFFELATPISLYAVADAVLGDEEKASLAAELAQRIVDDGSGERGRTGAARARNVARLSMLARSQDPKVREALRLVEGTSAVDPATRAVARELVGETGGGGRLAGRLERPQSSGPVRALALLSGVALLGWLGRGLLALIGARREATLSLEGAGLRVEERTVAFGRVLRQTSSSFTIAAVRTFAKETRWPRAHLYVGAIALGAGVIVGGTWVFDGVRGGDLGLLATGAAVCASGAALDLLLDVIVPMRAGRTAVEVVLDQGRRLRIGGIPAADADRVVELLRQRVH